MVSIVHNPNSSHTPIAASMNKGSCHDLAKYMSKEDGEWETCTGFFSNENDSISIYEAEEMIDNNHHGLKKEDDKFYMLTLNPSQKELESMIYEVTGRPGVKDLCVLTDSEREGVFNALKDYTRACMDRYAWNFNRVGVESGDDLVYFAKIETQRHYQGDDPEVIAGKVKSGDLKPGLQLHVHVCVSRKDKTQSKMLDPFGRSAAIQYRRDPNAPGFFKRKTWVYYNAQTFKTLFGYTDPLLFDSGERPYRNEFPSVNPDKSKEMDYWRYQLRRKAKRMLLMNGIMSQSDLLDPPKKAINAARFMLAFAHNPTHAIFRKLTGLMIQGAFQLVDGRI